MEDIQLLIVFLQNHACQGDKNEFFTLKLRFQLLLKWTGMVQATIHQNWGNVRNRWFSATPGKH